MLYWLCRVLLHVGNIQGLAGLRLLLGREACVCCACCTSYKKRSFLCTRTGGVVCYSRPALPPEPPRAASGAPRRLFQGSQTMLTGMPGLHSDAEAGISNRAGPDADVRPKRSAMNVVYCQVPLLTFARPAHRTGPLPALPSQEAAGGPSGSSTPGGSHRIPAPAAVRSAVCWLSTLAEGCRK